MKYLTFAFFISNLAIAASKDDLPPRFAYITSKTENSAISGECSFNDKSKQTINCKFEQISLSLPKMEDPAKAYSEITKTPKEAKSATDQARKVCIDITKKEEIPGLPDVETLRKICEKRESSKDFLKDFMDFMIGVSNSTCKISSNSFETEFKKAGDKWVSDSAPKGLCDISSVQVLESENGGFLWTFTQTRLAVGDTKSDFCKPLAESVGKPMKFDWRSRDINTSQCKLTKFGY